MKDDIEAIKKEMAGFITDKYTLIKIIANRITGDRAKIKEWKK